MENLSEFIDFVKEQVTFHEGKAARYEKRPAGTDNTRRAAAHLAMGAKFRSLLTYLERQGASKPALGVTRLGLSAEELEGLPEELLSELSITESDKADFNVLSIVEEAGGILSLDKILIGLYRKTGEVVKRTQLNSRIYRMVQRESMFNVPGKKGVYSLKPMSEEEAATLL